jgi:hypothetical protein
MLCLFVAGVLFEILFLLFPAKLKVKFYKKIYKTDNLEISFNFSEKIESEQFNQKYTFDYSDIIYFEDKTWFYLIVFKSIKNSGAYFLPKDCFTSDTENFEKFITQKSENLLTKKQYFFKVIGENMKRIIISIIATFYCLFFLSDV